MKKRHYRKLLNDEERRRKNVVQRVTNLQKDLASKHTENIGLSSRLLMASEDVRKLKDLKNEFQNLEDAIKDTLGAGNEHYAIYKVTLDDGRLPAEKALARSWIEILSILDWDWK